MTYLATVLDPWRAELTTEIMGGPSWPVMEDRPFMARLPIVGPRLVFMVDVDALTDEQRERLVVQLGGMFRMTYEEASHELDCRGFPILARDVRVVEQ